MSLKPATFNHAEGGTTLNFKLATLNSSQEL